MQRMEPELATTQSMVASPRSLLERPPTPIVVEHRSVGPVWAVAISGQVSAPGLDAWWEAAFREHYLVTGFDTDDESRLVTEVCWPVFQTMPSPGPGAPGRTEAM